MSTYRVGLSGKAAIFAVKKYHSHRRVPESVLMEFHELPESHDYSLYRENIL